MYQVAEDLFIEVIEERDVLVLHVRDKGDDYFIPMEEIELERKAFEHEQEAKRIRAEIAQKFH